MKVIRSVPILEVNFYKDLNDQSILLEPGYQPPIDDHVYSKIKLNYCNLKFNKANLLKKGYLNAKRAKQDQHQNRGFRGKIFRGRWQSKRGRGSTF